MTQNASKARLKKEKKIGERFNPKRKVLCKYDLTFGLFKRELRKKKQNKKRVLQHTQPGSPISESRFIPLDKQNEAPSTTPSSTMSPRPATPPSPAVPLEASHAPVSSSAYLSPATVNSEVKRNNSIS